MCALLALLVLVLAGCGASPGSTTTAAAAATPDYDVVIYGTTTAGIGVIRGLQLATGRYPGRLRVALVSSGAEFESPLAQGLGVEDIYGSEGATGFWNEFRQSVLAYYRDRGGPAVDAQQRLRYEPEAATAVLDRVVQGSGPGGPVVVRYFGRLTSAQDDNGLRWVELETTGGPIRLTSRYLVDASPEGDLGRLLGASYMIGRREDVYNDVTKPPPPPSRANDWATAPQSLSLLLTLQVFDGAAPLVSELRPPVYDPAGYGTGPAFSERTRAAFATSWTLRNVLPGNKRELNEAWSDYSDPVACFQWTLHPEMRDTIRSTIQTWVLNRVRYMQENGYPQVGVATLPSWPYVREGVRFLGGQVYTSGDMRNGVAFHTVASGRYALFDRHDAKYGATQVDIATRVFVPMETLMPRGHPWLLAPTAVSCDYRAYSSAVRMEPVRANLGEAAGVMIAIADARRIAAQDVVYSEVQAELSTITQRQAP